MTRYYSRSQGKFIEGEPPARASITTDSSFEDTGEEYGDPESLVRASTTVSKYPREQYQSDIDNDIATTGGKNLSKLEIKFKAYNPDEAANLQTEKDRQKEALKYQSSAESALKLLDLLNKKERGETSGPEYEAALQGAVSDYNSKRAFGEGGKNVTDIERQMLGGQLINVNVIKPNIAQRAMGWITGSMPATTSKVGEDEEKIRQKMIQAILRSNPEADVSGFQTSGQETSNVPQQKPREMVSSTGERVTGKPGELFTNIGTNVLDIAKGLPSLGREVLRMTPAEQVIDMITGDEIDPLEGAKTAINMGKGLLQNLAQTTGVNENTIGIGEDGHFYWNPGQQVKDALIHDYNHPIDTLFWILPFAKRLKGEGVIAKAGKDASIVEEALVKGTGKGALPEISLKARQATRGILNPLPEDFVKGEELTSKALRITKSNTYEGMARELKTIIPEEGAKIEKWAVAKDAEIGMQPIDEVVNQVMEKVRATSAAQANPKLIGVVEENLRNQIRTGQLEGGMVSGNIEGTNFVKMNDARKYFTSNLDSWFKNGQPVGTATNDLNAMKWETANGLKDVMAEADKLGEVQLSLAKQHTAFQTYPAVSSVVTETGTKISPIGIRWTVMRKVWEETGGKIMERVRIPRARALQGDLPIIAPQPSIPTPTSSALPPIAPQANFSYREEPGFWRGRAADTSRMTLSKEIPSVKKK